MNFQNIKNYSIYLGLNDQDNFEQKFSVEESKTMLQNIISKYFGGFTIIEANGHWLDSFNNVVKENTIIIKISDADDDNIAILCEELKTVFNQNCVMVEKTISPICFV